MLASSSAAGGSGTTTTSGGQESSVQLSLPQSATWSATREFYLLSRAVTSASSVVPDVVPKTTVQDSPVPIPLLFTFLRS